VRDGGPVPRGRPPHGLPRVLLCGLLKTQEILSVQPSSAPISRSRAVSPAFWSRDAATGRRRGAPPTDQAAASPARPG